MDCKIAKLKMQSLIPFQSVSQDNATELKKNKIY